MSQASFTFPEQAHTHLRLADVVQPGQRRPGRGFPAKPKYGNRDAHGSAVKKQATAVKSEFLTRPPTLGLNPDLVMVLETSRPIDIDDLHRIGLMTLELRSEKVLVAFAADAELKLFFAALGEYQKGSQGVTASGNERPAKYEAVFDSLDVIRQMSSSEMVSDRVVAKKEAAEIGTVVRLEITCWCGEDREMAKKRQTDVTSAVSSAGGQVIASTLRVESDASMLIVDLPVQYVDALTLLGRVRYIDVTSRPDLQYVEFRNATDSSLPHVAYPSESAPIVGIVDSGLRTGHP